MVAAPLSTSDGPWRVPRPSTQARAFPSREVSNLKPRGFLDSFEGAVHQLAPVCERERELERHGDRHVSGASNADMYAAKSTSSRPVRSSGRVGAPIATKR